MSGTPRSPYSSLRTPSLMSPLFNANASMSPGSVNSLFFGSSSALLASGGLDSPLANSPHVSTSQALQLIHRPTSLAEKARLNAGWVQYRSSEHANNCFSASLTISRA